MVNPCRRVAGWCRPEWQDGAIKIIESIEQLSNNSFTKWLWEKFYYIIFHLNPSKKLSFCSKKETRLQFSLVNFMKFFKFLKSKYCWNTHWNNTIEIHPFFYFLFEFHCETEIMNGSLLDIFNNTWYLFIVIWYIRYMIYS